jgi:type II secretory pathway component GspD/PulD (secretin)
VLIKSGDTLAIGGLLQDEITKGSSKVPIAGDIPLFGKLFQEKINTRVKRNLLVFVTPNIINEGYGTGLEPQIRGLQNTGNEFADPNGWRNNARGAIRLKKTPDQPLAAQYPAPKSRSIGAKYKVNAAALE